MKVEKNQVPESTVLYLAIAISTISCTILTFIMVRAADQKRFKAKARSRVQRGINSTMSNYENVVQNRLQNRSNKTSVGNSDSIEPASNKLRDWAIKHNVTLAALSELLKILVSFGLTWLPSDARTLLKTPQHTQVANVADGQLWYNGIEKNLREIFVNLNRDLGLQLNFNIDGIPPFKNSNKQFWPILANIHSEFTCLAEHTFRYISKALIFLLAKFLDRFSHC